MPKMTASVRERASLLPAEISAMYALFEAYYECTSFALFAADLQEKSHVILFRDENLPVGGDHGGHGGLCGFSTVTLLQWPGAPWHVLFSGDTIIDHQHWGEQALALEFCRFAGRIKARAPHLPLYWFLMSKGYRTYRYLHLFAREYWPARDNTGNNAGNDASNDAGDDGRGAGLEPVLHAVAHRKFGAAWDRASGLIRFPASRGQLRADWAQVREHLRQRPEVAFFLQRNPRYAEGEELACLTLLDETNMRGVARRAFLEGLHEHS